MRKRYAVMPLLYGCDDIVTLYHSGESVVRERDEGGKGMEKRKTQSCVTGRSK